MAKRLGDRVILNFKFNSGVLRQELCLIKFANSSRVFAWLECSGKSDVVVMEFCFSARASACTCVWLHNNHNPQWIQRLP